MSESGSTIELHGWDVRARAWNGPTPLQYPFVRARGTAGSWHGKLHAEVPGEPHLSFYACVHDLGDAGIGVLDLDGSDGGPLHFILVLPAHRRRKLRADFAFEFTAYLRFLEGPETLGCELAIHDYIETVLRGPKNVTLVFSIEAREVLPELQILVAQQAERLTLRIIAAMAKDERRSQADAAD